MPFADAPNGVQPSDERLALAGRSATGLSGPGALVNETDGDAAKLFTKFFALGLEPFEGDAGAAVELVIELAPNPGCGGVTGRLTAAVDSGAVTDHSGPRRCSTLKLGEQGAAQIEVGLAALEFEEPLIGVTVLIGIFVFRGRQEFGGGFRRLGQARSKLEEVLEIADFFFELEQLQIFITRVQDRQQGVIDRPADAHQFTVRAYDRGLFGQELLPAKSEVFELLFEREPGVLIPAEAIIDGIAKLHQRFLDFFAHVRRRECPEDRHLAVPAAGEVLTKSLEVRQFPQCVEMFREARVRVVHPCGFYEMAPGFVREQRERT